MGLSLEAPGVGGGCHCHWEYDRAFASKRRRTSATVAKMDESLVPSVLKHTGHQGRKHSERRTVSWPYVKCPSISNLVETSFWGRGMILRSGQEHKPGMSESPWCAYFASIGRCGLWKGTKRRPRRKPRAYMSGGSARAVFPWLNSRAE